MKRIIFVVCLLFFLTFGGLRFLAQNASAQESSASASTVIHSPELTNFAVFLQDFNAVLIGGQLQKGENISTHNLGILGFVSRTMDLMITKPPASSIDYVAFMADKLRFPGSPQQIYAADNGGGYGYRALQPLLGIWTLMRNIAYLVLAMVFVVVGLMIMFRVKIDPKTVTSIQTALPKMVFALILITFSYAIAGFLIDLMYLLIHIIIIIAVGTVSVSGNKALIAAYGEYLVNPGSFILGFPNLLLGAYVDVWSAVSAAIATGRFFSTPEMLGASLVGGILTGFIAGGPLGALVGVFAPAATTIGVPIVVAVIVGLLVALMILWAFFKTWLMLLNAYANIILAIIFSPVLLIMEAVPGQSSFWPWIRGLLSNILAFPAVIGMLLLGFTLSIGGLVGATGNVIKDFSCLFWLPIKALNMALSFFGPVTGLLIQAIPASCSASAQPFVPPLIGGNDPSAMQALIGLAIFLTIPKTLEIIQEWLKAPPFKYGNAWMENLSKNPIATTAADETLLRIGGTAANPTGPAIIGSLARTLRAAGTRAKVF